MLAAMPRARVAMPLPQRRLRGPKPPPMPGLRAAAVTPAAITWKLRIPWKLFTQIACFISTGCKVSTLTPPARSRWLDFYPVCAPKGITALIN